MTLSHSTSLTLHEDRVRGRFPGDTKLLHMNNFICIHDLVDESSNFVLVHFPDVIDSLLVRLLKSSELFLQLLELFSESLVLLGQLHVLHPIMLHQFFKI